MSITLIRGEEVLASGNKPTFQSSPAPNILHMTFTGLMTDQNGPALGLRAQADEFLALYPRSDYLIWAWDQKGMAPDDALRDANDLMDIYQQGNSQGKYTHLIVRGHSFGGCFAVFFCNWLATHYKQVSVNLAILLDPVPNNTSPTTWTLPMDTVRSAVQFIQHHGMGWWFPLGPNGTPVTDPSNSGRLNTISFSVTQDFHIDHISIVKDAAVWAMELDLMKAVVNAA